MSEGDVFKALADPTRRVLLDALAVHDGQTLTSLAALAPAMTRFGVMKHLRVLGAADLVVVQRVGRESRHFLNPVPIERIAHRWVSRYARPFVDGLLALDASLGASAAAGLFPSDRPDPARRLAVPDVTHVYQIFIGAPPAQVWAAVTTSEWTRRYFHGTSFAEPPTAGEPYLTLLPDGQPAIDGQVEEMVPPAPGRPGRFVVTWHVRYDHALAGEPSSRVEWTLTEAGPGLTRVRLVHDRLAESPLTAEDVRDGWVWVLDNLKTVLETGHPLPARVPA